MIYMRKIRAHFIPPFYTVLFNILNISYSTGNMFLGAVVVSGQCTHRNKVDSNWNSNLSSWMGWSEGHISFKFQWHMTPPRQWILIEFQLFKKSDSAGFYGLTATLGSCKFESAIRKKHLGFSCKIYNLVIPFLCWCVTLNFETIGQDETSEWLNGLLLHVRHWTN